MRVLVTGRGSIAKRHARHLRELVPDLELAVVSSTGQVDVVFQPCQVLANFAEGLAWQPQAVVISSISSRHADELLACLHFGLACLVEKPLVVSRKQLAEVRAAAGGISESVTLVGCNLRYLPVLQMLRSLVTQPSASAVLRAHLEVGQELAQWRPSRDLQSTYSAKGSHGGGVVFDLVHEIDMALWLLGPLQVHAAVGGQWGPQRMEADDVHVALLKTSSGTPVTISLDYVSKKIVRHYNVVTATGTYLCDLVAKSLTFSDAQGTRLITGQASDFDIANSYSLQMQDWLLAIQSQSHKLLSPLSSAMCTADVMLAMKEAAA